jgi:hypothetical protein
VDVLPCILFGGKWRSPPGRLKMHTDRRVQSFGRDTWRTDLLRDVGVDWSERCCGSGALWCWDLRSSGTSRGVVW